MIEETILYRIKVLSFCHQIFIIALKLTYYCTSCMYEWLSWKFRIISLWAFTCLQVYLNWLYKSQEKWNQNQWVENKIEVFKTNQLINLSNNHKITPFGIDGLILPWLIYLLNFLWLVGLKTKCWTNFH